MKTMLAFLVLALAGGGCVTNSSVTDGDRQVNTQTHGAARKVQEALEAIQAAFPGAAPQVAVALAALGDVLSNAEHLEKVQGPPKEPKPYTPENARSAREQSEKEHQEGWITSAGLIAGGLVTGLAGALLGMPWLATRFPALAGQVGRFSKTAISIFAAARQKGESMGGALPVKDLLAIAKEHNVTAGVQNWVAKASGKLEEQLGVKFAVKLAESPPAAAPPVTPQPST